MISVSGDINQTNQIIKNIVDFDEKIKIIITNSKQLIELFKKKITNNLSIIHELMLYTDISSMAFLPKDIKISILTGKRLLNEKDYKYIINIASQSPDVIKNFISNMYKNFQRELKSSKSILPNHDKSNYKLKTLVNHNLNSLSSSKNSNSLDDKKYSSQEEILNGNTLQLESNDNYNTINNKENLSTNDDQEEFEDKLDMMKMKSDSSITPSLVTNPSILSNGILVNKAHEKHLNFLKNIRDNDQLSSEDKNLLIMNQKYLNSINVMNKSHLASNKHYVGNNILSTSTTNSKDINQNLNKNEIPKHSSTNENSDEFEDDDIKVKKTSSLDIISSSNKINTSNSTSATTISIINNPLGLKTEDINSNSDNIFNNKSASNHESNKSSDYKAESTITNNTVNNFNGHTKDDTIFPELSVSSSSILSSLSQKEESNILLLILYLYLFQ